MQSIPKGDFLKEEISPDGSYTVKAYCVNGGATVDFAIRCELSFNKSQKKSKNIYWNYHQGSADIEWISNEEVRINGYELNVLTDEYDFRRH